MARAASFAEAAHCLVLLGQQNRRSGAVVLGDDVELHAGLRVKHGEQARALAQTPLVFQSVFVVHVAPIAVMMAKECGLHFLGGHAGERAGCGDGAAK